MKKLSIILTASLCAGLLSLSSCGDDDAAEQARLDSIRMQRELDSIAMVERQQFLLDSAMRADSLLQDSLERAAAMEGGTVSKTTTKKSTTKTSGGKTVEVKDTKTVTVKPTVEPTSTKSNPMTGKGGDGGKSNPMTGKGGSTDKNGGKKNPMTGK